MALEHDVADLQNEVESLRSENNALRTDNAVKSAQIEIGNAELDRLRAVVDYEVKRSDAMDQIIRTVSVGLIDGIRRYESLEGMERSARRAIQEGRLGVGDQDAPPIAQRGPVGALTPTEGVLSKETLERILGAPEPREMPSGLPGVIDPEVAPILKRTQPVITRVDGPPKDRVTQRVGDRHLDTAKGLWWEMEIGGWRCTGEREPGYGPGQVRTDIVDSRLPALTYPEPDVLRNMNDQIAARQGAVS